MWKHGLVGAVLVGSAWAQVTQRVSLDSRGQEANDHSFVCAISADGRYVVFASWATNLVSENTQGVLELFLRDRALGTTEILSVSSNDEPANDQAWDASISADGRYVVYASNATNLVPGDFDMFTRDIFLRDRTARTTECLTCALQDHACWDPAISADGRSVVFMKDIGFGIPTACVYDSVTGATQVVGPSGNGGRNDIWYLTCAISGDGRCVAYSTYGNDLVSGDDDDLPDVFACDRTGSIECVSTGPNGPQGNRSSFWPSLSNDGRYVAFASVGAHLVPGDSNACTDIFVRDRRQGTTERVSVDSIGRQGNGSSFGPSISADGRFVAFYSRADNLDHDDINVPFRTHAFVHDRLSGTTERADLGPGGLPVLNGCSSLAPRISADGRFVAFESASFQLVPGDTNGKDDVFVRDRFGDPTFTSMCDPGSSGVIACPCSNPPGGSDQGCDNSSSTGGATLSATGGTYISSDSLEFHVTGTTPSALSLLLQGTAPISTGAVYGQGVRCVGGAITRLGTKHASGGSITIPDFEAGDPQVSVVSAVKGDLIQPGDSRFYLVYYRDPIVLGGCPASSTFNCTQTGRVTWSP